MAWYPFRRQAAVNSANVAVNSGVGQIYAVTDTTFTTPLQVRAIASPPGAGTGSVLPNVAIADFLSGEFEAQESEVYWKSGALPPVYLFSATGMRDATIAASASSVVSAAAAVQAKNDANATATTAAATILAPVDAQVATILTNPASATWALFPRALEGTYAARPAANTVAPGSVYSATNVPEQYRSNGTVWRVVGSGGNELGYAESTATFQVTGSTPTDVTGLTTTFVAGERPVEVRFDGDITHATSGGVTVLYLVVGSTTYARPNGPAHAAGNNGLQTVSRRARVTGLTPGTTYTAKLQMATPSGTSTVQGAVGNPMALSVVTL